MASKKLTLEEVYHLLPSPLSPEYAEAWKNYKNLFAMEQEKQNLIQQSGSYKKQHSVTPINKDVEVNKSTFVSWTALIIFVIFSEILLLCGIILLSVDDAPSVWVNTILMTMILLPICFVIKSVKDTGKLSINWSTFHVPDLRQGWFVADGSLRYGTKDMLEEYKDSLTGTHYRPTGFSNYTKR